MRALVKTITLTIFDWVFGVRIAPELVESVKFLAQCDIRITEENVDTIKLLANDDIVITNDNVDTIRLLSHENIQIQKERVNSVRVLTKSGLEIDDNDIALIQSLRRIVGKQGVGKLGAFISANTGLLTWFNTDFFNTLNKIFLLGRLQDVDDIGEGIPLCYSQEGEGMILDRVFNYKNDGFYIDIGAHHPKRFSNTYALYKRGWRGINIEPTPNVKKLFDAIRPEDIFVPIAVSDEEGERDFYIFRESALNTFCKDLADEYRQSGMELAEIRRVRSRKLCGVLDELEVDTPIDLLSIDVEGCEAQVLRSNDWSKYRPKVLLVEILDYDVQNPEKSPVHNLITELDYKLFAKTYNTLFYKDIT